MKPVLTICIATYNRSDYLIENLSVLFPQLLEVEDKIELLILDNFSDELNYNKLISFLDKSEVVYSFIRHEMNTDGMPNLFTITSMAKGDYLFLLGDDDILSPNFINIILPVLESRKYSLIHWNRLIGNACCDENRVQRKHFDGVTKEITMLEFLSDTTFDATFISSLIISKEAWEIGEPFMRKEHYGYTWYSRMCYGALKDGRPVFWYYMPLVLHRNPAKEWAKLYPIYLILGLGNIYRDLDKEYPGLLNVGIKWIHQTNVEREIRNMANNQNFYQPYEAEMAQYLTREEIRLMHYWLHVKNVKWARRREHYMKKLKSLFKNIK